MQIRVSPYTNSAKKTDIDDSWNSSQSRYVCYNHSTVPGIYGSIYKQSESEGVARGRGLFTTAINPWPPVL